MGFRRFHWYVVNIGRWSSYEGGQLDRFYCTRILRQYVDILPLAELMTAQDSTGLSTTQRVESAAMQKKFCLLCGSILYNPDPYYIK
jgi:hypothetical protein